MSLFCLHYFYTGLHTFYAQSIFDPASVENTLRTHKFDFITTKTLCFTKYNFITMSNLEDTDSASSASSDVEMARFVMEDMSKITVEDLYTLSHGFVNRALVEWAMVTPQRKFAYVQVLKQAMRQNNLWTHTEDTLIEEIRRFPPTDDQWGLPDDLFTFNDIEDRHGINVWRIFAIKQHCSDDSTLSIIETNILYGNCPKCFKAMPVGFHCPNCGVEQAKVLHCTPDHLEEIYREKTNQERRLAIMEDPEHFARADALRLSEMVKQSPLIELDYNQYTGPSADYVWSLERKHFFTIEQFVDEMKEQDTLSAHVPDLFSHVQGATNVTPRALCDGLRPIMNRRNMFTLDEHEQLAPQLREWIDEANRQAQNEREGEHSDEDQS